MERPHKLPEIEIAKCFVSGLKPNILREEMYSKTFENLDDIIREPREELSTYRNIILKNLDRIKNSEPKMDFGKDKRDYSKSVATFPKKTEVNLTSGATFSPYKKSSTFGAKDDLKDVMHTNAKMDIMQTNVPKLRPKIRRGRLKLKNG